MEDKSTALEGDNIIDISDNGESTNNFQNYINTPLKII